MNGPDDLIAEEFAFAPPRTSPEPDPRREWQIWSAADIDEWPDVPQEWIVEKLVPRGSMGFITAPPKTWKSWLLADMAAHISHAQFKPTRWLGEFLCTPVNTLIVSCEDRLPRIKRRIEEIVIAQGWQDFPLLGLDVVAHPKLRLNDSESMKRLYDTVHEAKAEFLILDPLCRMIPGLDENSATDMGSVVTILEALRDDLHLTLEIADHTGKPSNEARYRYPRPSSFDQRGSTAKFGGAEFMICMNRGRSGCIQVEVDAKDGDAESFDIDVSPPGCTNRPKFSYASIGADRADLIAERIAKGAANRDRVAAAIGKGRWLGRAAICKLVSLTESTVTKHASALVAAGRIRKRGDNKSTEYCGI